MKQFIKKFFNRFMPCTYSNSDSMCNDFAYIYYDVCA